MMLLKAGQRLELDGMEKPFLKVISGRVEIYAVTKGQATFRQMFLTEIGEGDFAYPAMDDFGGIAMSAYAVTDAEIELMAEEEAVNAANVPAMLQWFHRLYTLPWIERLAANNDDLLVHWQRGTMFEAAGDDLRAIAEIFSTHEKTLSMLIGLRFNAEDTRFRKRLSWLRQHQAKILERSTTVLMGEELPADDAATFENPQFADVIFVVDRVRSALAMPPVSLALYSKIVSRLNQVSLIRRLIKKCGMEMRLVHLEKGWHHKDSGVMIGYYGDKKTLAALLPDGASAYRLFTKENPEGIPVTDEEAARLDLDAFACYAGLPARELSASDMLKFITRHIWTNDAYAVHLASLLAGFVAMAVPMATATVFQDIVPIFDYAGLSTVTQIVAVAAITTFIVTLVRSVAILRLSSSIDMNVEAAILSRLFALPTRFFRQFPSGELVSKLMGVSAIKGVMRGNVLEVVFNFVFSFWSLALMFYYNVKLTLVAVALWIVFLILMLAISSRVLTFQENEIKAKNRLDGIVQQIFTGLSKFRLHGGESEAFFLWSRAFGAEWKWNMRLRWLTNYRTILIAVEPLVITLVLYFVLAEALEAALAEGRDPSLTVISYANFVAFQSAFTGLNATITAMIPTVIQILSLRPYLVNMLPFLTEVPETSDDRMDAAPLVGGIRVEHLTFAYGADQPNVLDDLSFEVAPGESVAIVGRSGCGKSTFIRLLLGFESPKNGVIYFDGQDLAELNPTSVRTQMGVVLQNGQLMTGDIFSNIVGTLSLSREDAWDAAEAAGIAADIRNMPMGMQTVISEGSSNISGGQRQRILIARALAGHPAILVFDEATSALDNRTQAIVMDSLRKAKATRIIVAHRLSTIRDVDRILVFDKGRVAESGTFDDLVAQGGIFAELVRRQVA